MRARLSGLMLLAASVAVSGCITRPAPPLPDLPLPPELAQSASPGRVRVEIVSFWDIEHTASSHQVSLSASLQTATVAALNECATGPRKLDVVIGLRESTLDDPGESYRSTSTSDYLGGTVEFIDPVSNAVVGRRTIRAYLPDPRTVSSPWYNDHRAATIAARAFASEVCAQVFD